MTQLTAQTPPPPGDSPGDSPGDLNEEHGGAWIWPTIVLGLLGLQIVICLVAFVVATSDPSGAVVRDYHSKALAWDEHMAKQRAGEALGWGVALVVAERADMLGGRMVRLSMKDTQGEPLTGVAVGVSAFHLARASQVFDADMKEAAPGVYVTQMKMRKAGRWELVFVARRGEDVYSFTLRQQVGADGWKPR